MLHLRMRITDLSNEQLLADLKALLAEGSRITAKIVAYLVEVEDRRLHLEAACSSMFDFCLRKLGLSEGETQRRLTAARLAKRFPVLLEALRSRKIHLSSLVLLRDLFTEDNVTELLEAASGKSKREVELLVARLAPRPDVAPSIRRLPETVADAGASAGAPEPTRLAPMPAPAPRALFEPLSEGRNKVQFTASDTLREKLEHACALMGHRNPTGDLPAVVEKAVDLLIQQLEKEKMGMTERPRRTPATNPSNPGYVTRAARRAVMARDGLQCTFVSEDGERCPARAFLEIDHRHPRALGGTGEASNLRVLCRPHNKHAAEKVFGRSHVEERIHLSRNKSKQVTETRDRLRQALRSMGFRAAELDRTGTAPVGPPHRRASSPGDRPADVDLPSRPGAALFEPLSQTGPSCARRAGLP